MWHAFRGFSIGAGPSFRILRRDTPQRTGERKKHDFHVASGTLQGQQTLIPSLSQVALHVQEQDV